MGDGPRDPSFWLYGEEDPNHISQRIGSAMWRCPRCGTTLRSSEPIPKCPKCKVFMQMV